ncbi:MAG: SDR family oxidoreductase [Planctomycetes bacterium]|nr:SDR family oxidoreductase [Planctomycetota bacterium]
MAPPAAPVTIVTGSSRGIGRAIAGALGRDGHRLVLVARDGDRLDQAAAELQRDGVDVATFVCDLREADAVERVLAATERHFGTPDVVVSNAGTAPSDKIENTTTAMMQEAFDLHVAAPLAFARGTAAAMKQRGSGCLLHLASTAGLRGFPFTSAYTAAKHGMVGLSRALAEELAPRGLQVYAVCPGFVDSDITRKAAAAVAAKGRTSADEALARMGRQNRIGRMHSCEEVAEAVALLLRERPAGCVFDLDRDPAAFLD